MGIGRELTILQDSLKRISDVNPGSIDIDCAFNTDAMDPQCSTLTFVHDWDGSEGSFSASFIIVSSVFHLRLPFWLWNVSTMASLECESSILAPWKSQSVIIPDSSKITQSFESHCMYVGQTSSPRRHWIRRLLLWAWQTTSFIATSQIMDMGSRIVFSALGHVLLLEGSTCVTNQRASGLLCWHTAWIGHDCAVVQICS
jgi:hypothetical protein